EGISVGAEPVAFGVRVRASCAERPARLFRCGCGEAVLVLCVLVGTDLRIVSVRGAIQVTDVVGSVSVDTVAGDVSIEGAGSAISASSHAGDVSIEPARQRLARAHGQLPALVRASGRLVMRAIAALRMLL